MMKAWQRRANKLALDWGVANRRQVEVIRKGFEGWARTSAITGESEPHYPEWRRSVKYVLTGVVMLMQILMMVLIVCALYVGYFLVNSKYTGFPKYALNLGLSTAWGSRSSCSTGSCGSRWRCGSPTSRTTKRCSSTRTS